MVSAVRPPILEVTIVPDFEEWSAGGTDRILFVTSEDLERSDPDLLRPLVEAEVEVSVAGYVGEKISSGDAMDGFIWGEDAMRALDWLQRLEGNRYVHRFEEIVEESEKKLLEPRVWKAVAKVAEALLERKTLTGTEAAGILLAELWEADDSGASRRRRILKEKDPPGSRRGHCSAPHTDRSLSPDSGS